MGYVIRIGLIELVGLGEDTHSRAVALTLLEKVIQRCLASGATVICLPVTDEDEILTDILARLQFDPVGTVGSADTVTRAETEEPAAVVGDGGESDETTLHVRFE